MQSSPCSVKSKPPPTHGWGIVRAAGSVSTLAGVLSGWTMLLADATGDELAVFLRVAALAGIARPLRSRRRLARRSHPAPGLHSSGASCAASRSSSSRARAPSLLRRGGGLSSVSHGDLDVLGGKCESERLAVVGPTGLPTALGRRARSVLELLRKSALELAEQRRGARLARSASSFVAGARDRGRRPQPRTWRSTRGCTPSWSSRRRSALGPATR